MIVLAFVMDALYRNNFESENFLLLEKACRRKKEVLLEAAMEIKRVHEAKAEDRYEMPQAYDKNAKGLSDRARLLKARYQCAAHLIHSIALYLLLWNLIVLVGGFFRFFLHLSGYLPGTLFRVVASLLAFSLRHSTSRASTALFVTMLEKEGA